MIEGVSEEKGSVNKNFSIYNNHDLIRSPLLFRDSHKLTDHSKSKVKTSRHENICFEFDRKTHVGRKNRVIENTVKTGSIRKPIDTKTHKLLKEIEHQITI